MGLSHKEIIRISETSNIILREPRINNGASILEVGCGDGRVSETLKRKFKLTGIDIDRSRLSHFPGEKILADISEIPLKNEKFDLVLCCEVLEHLDEEAFFNTLSEILRVTKKYILITVPFEETLSSHWMKCSKCGQIFHAWGHVRRFDLKSLKQLFTRARLVEAKYLTPTETRVPSFLYFIARKLGNAWESSDSNDIFCPKCRSMPLKCEGNILGKMLLRIIWRIDKISPFKKPIWIACLFQKTGKV